MINFNDISLKYENRDILKDFNLKIYEKERIVIIGASGSGKTTILKLIAGFIAPTSGTLKIDDKIVSKDGKIIAPPHQRDVSMVFQDLALWPHMNVYENIEFGLKIQNVSKDQRFKSVERFLKLVGLESYGQKKVDQLSGGQQQRVALARALIVSPKVLLMDEPLSSLDVELNVRLRGEIVRLQEELGFTLVYVTHSKEEAEVIGTKIIRMKED